MAGMRYMAPANEPKLDKRKHFDYAYPNGLDLKPYSKLHERLKSEILRRGRSSMSVVSQRYATWRDMRDSMTVFMPLDEYEKEIKKKDKRKPVSIVVPMSYAIMDTLLTYMVSAFLKETMVFQYKGTGPEDQVGAYLLSKVIERQTMKAKMVLSLHTMFRDNFVYGVGAVAPVWTKRLGTKYRVDRETSVGSDGTTTILKKRVRTQGTIYEGNELYNINPFRLLPDPSTPINRIQDGEFIGWVDSTNYISLLEEETSQKTLFNVKYLRDIDGKSTLIRYNHESDQDRDPLVDTTLSDSGGLNRDACPVDVIYMYVNIVPSEWGLSDKDTPEKWMFGLAADEVIVDARPIGLDHGMFPVAAAASEYDGYSTTNISRIEIVGGTQTIINHLVNSHIANVRKAVNDMLIYDPFMLNSEDISNPEPGKLVRLRPEVWGRPGAVNDSIKQLTVSDITRNNIADSGYMWEVMQTVSGATDALQGINKSGRERVSAFESKSVIGAALSKLEKIAKIISAMAMQDIGTMLASNTVQFMEESAYIDILGDARAEILKDVGANGSRLVVAPEDLVVNYDLMPFDNSMNTASYAETWKEILGILLQNGANMPELMQRLDVFKIFSHVAKLSGAGNINDFVRQGGSIQAQVMPDDQVAAMANVGNVVPVGGV